MSRQEAFELTFTVEPYLDGSRVDTFLARHLRNYTVWRLQRLVHAAQVRVADEVVVLDRRVFRGETVTIRLLEPPDKLHAPETVPLRIVYEDPWIIVVDKPANMVVHPVSSLQSGTLANGLQAHLDLQTPLKGLLRPGIVHRLDRMTSGLIVTTKHHLAHRRLSIDFQSGKVEKSYLAVLHGQLEPDSGTIDLPLGRQRNSILMTTAAGGRDYKPAKTTFRVIDRFVDRTLVEARPVTGRIHQIRVHFAAIGHPLLGDEFYSVTGPVSISPGCARHALHAAKLAFRHPILHEPLEFCSALPADLSGLLDGTPGTH